MDEFTPETDELDTRIFQCLVCDKEKYAYAKSLIEHIQLLHPDTTTVVPVEVPVHVRNIAAFPNKVKEIREVKILKGEDRFKNALI